MTGFKDVLCGGDHAIEASVNSEWPEEGGWPWTGKEGM